MILKEYQQRALAAVRGLLDELARQRDRAEKVRAVDPEWKLDWAREAWEAVPARPYTRRTTGTGEPLPSFCLKIPTGGGKTLLATRVIDLVHSKLLYRQSGLVLWIVPTTQIYRQTLIALKDRDHPYRQQLDLASAGRTMVLEKTSGFRPADVADSLCILLLMLPSANRETKEQLRMFRDSGGFDRFFPADDDAAGHRALLERVPNLDTFEGGGFWGRQIKTSLGNTLRLLRPMIVLDEGHKAYSRNAKGHAGGVQSIADRGAVGDADRRGERADRDLWPRSACGGDDQARPAHQESVEHELEGHPVGGRRAPGKAGGACEAA